MPVDKEKVEVTTGRKSLLQKILWGFVALAFVFLLGYLAGYIPQRQKINELTTSITDQEKATRDVKGDVQKLKQTIQQKDFELLLAALRDDWMMVHLEVLKNNYGNALSLASTFFDRLQGALGQAGSSDRNSALMEISKERDQITALLAKADPTVRERVDQILIRLHEIAKPEAS